VGEPKPLVRFFLEQHVQEIQLDVTRRGQAFGAFAAVAVFIACLGVFGLAAFTAERRTREIGIRRAMGAARGQIMRLLLWQFARPVLWANLIAWPVSAWLLARWLNGFAYHVPLEPWVFVLASGVALTIALFTVSIQAYQAARAEPVKALQHL
jgi:putative ABC transport system permease protein